MKIIKTIDVPTDLYLVGDLDFSHSVGNVFLYITDDETSVNILLKKDGKTPYFNSCGHLYLFTEEEYNQKLSIINTDYSVWKLKNYQGDICIKLVNQDDFFDSANENEYILETEDLFAENLDLDEYLCFQSKDDVEEDICVEFILILNSSMNPSDLEIIHRG